MQLKKRGSFTCTEIRFLWYISARKKYIGNKREK